MATTAVEPERKVSAEQARAVAEASRETDWDAPSFVRELFLGTPPASTSSIRIPSPTPRSSAARQAVPRRRSSASCESRWTRTQIERDGRDSRSA